MTDRAMLRALAVLSARLFGRGDIVDNEQSLRHRFDRDDDLGISYVRSWRDELRGGYVKGWNR